MCRHCDFEQVLTNIRMLLGSDLHILDQARLERLRFQIERRAHVTPMEKQEIETLESNDPGVDELDPLD